MHPDPVDPGKDGPQADRDSLMSKKTLIVIGAMMAFMLAALLILRAYQLDLIHAVVVNAVIRKSAPADRRRIQEAFARSRSRAEAGRDESEYLNRLLEISQKLERIQTLDADRLEEILKSLEE